MTTKIIRMSLLLAAALILMYVMHRIYITKIQPNEPLWNEAPGIRQPDVPLNVEYGEDFKEPTRYAIRFWNDQMPGGDQDLFRVVGEGPTVKILGANGEPCGKMMTEDKPGDHAAHAYQCPDGNWEVHIWSPGDLKDQLCIIVHEMGHVLGLADDKSGSGIMNNQQCPELVRLSDKDKAGIRERYGR